jgi:hypothetical protein
LVGPRAGDRPEPAAALTVACASVAKDERLDPATTDILVDREAGGLGKALLAAEEIGRRLAAFAAEMAAEIEAEAVYRGCVEIRGFRRDKVDPA